MNRLLLLLARLLRARLAGAGRRHFRRRALGGARRGGGVRRGGGGGRLRPRLGLRGRAEPDRHQRPCRRAGAAGQECPDRRRPVRGRGGAGGADRRRRSRRAISPCSKCPGANFTPIPLYLGPLDDGAAVAALGYPGNVDLATARSADDYITPLPPTRSVGIFSNVRPINGITTLAAHRQYRARPFGRAAARPVRPGARRQHADHPQPGRRRALRLRRRQSRAHRSSSARPASPSRRSPPNASR